MAENQIPLIDETGFPFGADDATPEKIRQFIKDDPGKYDFADIARQYQTHQPIVSEKRGKTSLFRKLTLLVYERFSRWENPETNQAFAKLDVELRRDNPYMVGAIRDCAEEK